MNITVILQEPQEVVNRTAVEYLVFPFSSLSLDFLFGQACL